MTRILTCGFESRSYGEMTYQNHAFSTTIKRSPGGAAYQGTTAGYYAGYLHPTALPEMYLRYAVYATGATVNTQLRVRSETNADVMAFNYAINQPIQVYLYGTSWSLLGATSVNVPNATWQLIEMHIRFHPTAGIIEIKQDGVMTFFYRGGTSLQGVPCRLIQWENAANSFAYVDDIAINDTSGTEDNSWPGDGYTVLVPVVAQGDAADWNGSDGDKTDNFLLVDDVPADAETSYIFAGAPGAKDLYVPGAFALTEDAIQRVWVAGHVRKLFTFSQGVEFGIKQDGIEPWSAAQLLPTASYAVLRSTFWTTNPVTNAAWTEDDLNELQVGIRIP